MGCVVDVVRCVGLGCRHGCRVHGLGIGKSLDMDGMSTECGRVDRGETLDVNRVRAESRIWAGDGVNLR